MLQTPEQKTELTTFLDETFDSIQQLLGSHQPALGIREIGTVVYASQSIARISGLFGVESEELVTFENGLQGMAFNLDMDEVGVILLGDGASLHAGSEVYRTGRVMDVPVGSALLGRVVDTLGHPLDDMGPLKTNQRLPIERPAPPIMHRAPVTEPLQTGIKVIDALLPIGRGQRELILGDRQTGKSAIALDAILNQRETGVVCVYCVVGQRNAAVAKLIAALRQHDALSYTTVVVASGEDAPGLQYIAPYAATSIAESFMLSGRDVLIIHDDLTHHARAYRELSLLLRRPPGREAYPGDIFYIHSRLLERSTHLRPEYGGGSLTALPIIETQAQDMSAYISTNLISITDGQIYLSPDLMRKGMLPAVDVGKSVSRVGGNAQLPAYRSVAGDTRLTYAQFEELEIFSRLSTRLDDETRRTLTRGRRVREILKQAQYSPMSAFEQITALLAVTRGILDHFPIEKIDEAAGAVQRAVLGDLVELSQRVNEGGILDEADCAVILQTARHALGSISTKLE